MPSTWDGTGGMSRASGRSGDYGPQSMRKWPWFLLLILLAVGVFFWWSQK